MTLPGDIASFLAPPDPYGCWVADRNGEVLGHVALVPRSPLLDVDTELAAAIALYESAGWTRAGEVTVRWGDDRALTEYVYLGPGPGRAASGRGGEDG